MKIQKVSTFFSQFLFGAKIRMTLGWKVKIFDVSQNMTFHIVRIFEIYFASASLRKKIVQNMACHPSFIEEDQQMGDNSMKQSFAP